MQQGKLLVVVAVLAAFCTGLAQGWWNDDCATAGNCLYVQGMGASNFIWSLTDLQKGSVWLRSGYVRPSFNAEDMSTPAFDIPPTDWSSVNADDFSVPAGEMWTIANVSFVASDGGVTPLPLYEHLWFSFYNNTQRVQNSLTFNQPDQNIYTTRCVRGVNFAKLESPLFMTRDEGVRSWVFTCTFATPLVVDNLNGTSPIITWFSILRHRDWNLNLLWRYAQFTSGVYILNPSTAGNNLATWCGVNAKDSCASPWNSYSTTDPNLFSRWWSFAPPQILGTSPNNNLVCHQLEHPVLFRGVKELLPPVDLLINTEEEEESSAAARLASSSWY